jgi:hypothetical protein
MTISIIASAVPTTIFATHGIILAALSSAGQVKWRVYNCLIRRRCKDHNGKEMNNSESDQPNFLHFCLLSRERLATQELIYYEINAPIWIVPERRPEGQCRTRWNEKC